MGVFWVNLGSLFLCCPRSTSTSYLYPIISQPPVSLSPPNPPTHTLHIHTHPLTYTPPQHTHTHTNLHTHTLNIHTCTLNMHTHPQGEQEGPCVCNIPNGCILQ